MMMNNPSSSRLLKKVQMHGGAPGTHPEDGCRREAYCLTPLALSLLNGLALSPSKGAASRERGGTCRRWVSADGPFSAACQAARDA